MIFFHFWQGMKYIAQNKHSRNALGNIQRGVGINTDSIIIILMNELRNKRSDKITERPW